MTAPGARTEAARRGPPIRVLMVGPDPAVHGGIAAVETLILAHAPAGVEMRLVPTYVEGGVAARARVFLRGMAELVRRLRADEADLVHIHFASRGSTFRKMLLGRIVLGHGVPLVLHAHGGGFREFVAGMPAVARRAVGAVIRRAARLVVLSDGWRSFYVDTFALPEGRVVALPNPVRLRDPRGPAADLAPLRVVSLGRISHAKGSFDLIEAVAALGARPIALTLAGDGEIDDAAALAERLGVRATLPGWVDEPARDALLAEADVLALPSYAEGMPMAVLEAMAAGVPVIATPVGGVPELIQNDETGLLVAPGDVAGLADALARLAANPALRDQLARAARAVVERYDVRHYVARLEVIYREVLDGVRTDV